MRDKYYKVETANIGLFADTLYDKDVLKTEGGELVVYKRQTQWC